MLTEMAQGFDSWPWFDTCPIDNLGCSETTQWNPNSTDNRKTYLGVPQAGWEMHGASGYCR